MQWNLDEILLWLVTIAAVGSAAAILHTHVVRLSNKAIFIITSCLALGSDILGTIFATILTVISFTFLGISAQMAPHGRFVSACTL